MNNTRRGLLAAGLITTASIANTAWLVLAQPQAGSKVAIAQVNGGEEQWRELLTWHAMHQWPNFLAQGIIAATLTWWVKPYIFACCVRGAQTALLVVSRAHCLSYCSRLRWAAA